MRLLLVEDDRRLATLLTQALRQRNHVVEWVADGESGWTYADAGPYDLVILDIGLPGLDGLSLCRRLRAQGYEQPILILTAREERAERIQGLDAGADDYIVKPYDLEELLARVRALLRRGTSTSAPVMQWGDLCLDPGICQVSYQQQPISLTPKEYGLLELFLRHEGRVFSLQSILEQLWSFDDSPGEETVRVHVRGLRQKLKKAGVPPQIIETVYGLGYRLGSPPESPSQIPPDLAPAQVSVAPPTAPQKGSLQVPTRSQQMLQALASTWEQFRPETVQQVQQIATRLQTTADLDQAQLEEILRQVHQLKGVLGTYGLPTGSTTAKRLEDLLRTKPPLSLGQRRRALFLCQALEAILREEHQLPLSTQILVISTDRSLTPQLQEWLQDQPLQLIACADPDYPLQAATEVVSDLVLIDMNLGRGQGMTCCRQLLKHPDWKGVPVIPLVDRSDLALLQELLAIDITDFIHTPLQKLECVTRIWLRLGYLEISKRVLSDQTS